MQFITTDQRIAVEAFTIGKIYQVNFTDSNYFIGACIGVGDNFVMFQSTAPESLFALTMESATSVSSIDEAGGGSGTTDYNDLSNKPQINGVELSGNKSLDNLGIQAKLTFDSAPTEDSENPVESGGVYGALAGKQDTISDLSSIRSGAAAGATAVQPADVIAALATKQDVLTTEQLAAVNSGVTSTDVEQIETNKNNISKDEAALVELVDSGAKNHINNTLTSGTTPSGNISYTVNTDKSITIIGGTATANADIVIPFSVDNSGTYVLTGGADGGSGSTYKGQIVLYPSMDGVAEVFNDTSVETTLTAGTDYAFRFRVYSGKTVPDCTIYPMICTKAAWDISHEYQPYAMSNAEITAWILAHS